MKQLFIDETTTFVTTDVKLGVSKILI